MPESVADHRSIDGFGNNHEHPEWGAAGANFARHAPIAYTDGVSVPDIEGRPNPRLISNVLFRQTESQPSERQLSGFVYTFGQFISHDIQQTLSGFESIDFRIPEVDDMLRPGLRIPFNRSVTDPATGTAVDNPLQQINFTTGFLDGSAIYGATEQVASNLRGGPALPGAKLRTSNDINGDGQNLLPRDAFGPTPTAPFVAGDSRVNDTIVLTSIQTLFMREHNRLVDELIVERPDWSDEQLYQRARKIVGAKLQAITYNEFLPALMGDHAPSPDGQYDPNINPTVVNEFPAVFLRVGHSMLTSEIKRVQNDGQPSPDGPLPLEEAFQDPTKLTTSEALDHFLKGLSQETQEETDMGFVDGMRLALLGAFDIQRARDHGLPDYNTLREAYGLPRVASFREIGADESVQQKLEELFIDVDSIDPLAGALAERHLPGTSLGPLVIAGFQLQFERLRDGDRFWYQNDPSFSEGEIDRLRRTRLSDVIRLNTGITNIQENVFFVPEPCGSFFLLCACVFHLTRNLSPRALLSHTFGVRAQRVTIAGGGSYQRSRTATSMRPMYGPVVDVSDSMLSYACSAKTGGRTFSSQDS